jgi:hypothetical protein
MVGLWVNITIDDVGHWMSLVMAANLDPLIHGSTELFPSWGAPCCYNLEEALTARSRLQDALNLQAPGYWWILGHWWCSYFTMEIYWGIECLGMFSADFLGHLGKSKQILPCVKFKYIYKIRCGVRNECRHILMPINIRTRSCLQD